MSHAAKMYTYFANSRRARNRQSADRKLRNKELIYEIVCLGVDRCILVSHTCERTHCTSVRVCMRPRLDYQGVVRLSKSVPHLKTVYMNAKRENPLHGPTETEGVFSLWVVLFCFICSVSTSL